MAKVYKMFQMKWTEAWYQLSEDEQSALLDKVTEAREKVGGSVVILCDGTWSNEEWLGFGVEEFPSVEAVQQHSKLLDELNWMRYIDSRSMIGTEWQPPS